MDLMKVLLVYMSVLLSTSAITAPNGLPTPPPENTPPPIVSSAPSQSPGTPTFTPDPSADPTVTPTPWPMLESGSRGDAVEALQKRLNQLKYLYDNEVDRVFGPRTQAAVKQFQKNNGLSADGIVGAKTYAALFSDDVVEGPLQHNSPSPTLSPSPTPTAAPTATPTPDPTATPTAVPTATPTPDPTATPTAVPTATPTPNPTATPTAEPTATPTADPTATPTADPTATPTAEPTATPTADPTATPTADPTSTPTADPTADPTATPTVEPTADPTATPTAEPTATPTAEPLPVALPIVGSTIHINGGTDPAEDADGIVILYHDGQDEENGSVYVPFFRLALSQEWPFVSTEELPPSNFKVTVVGYVLDIHYNRDENGAVSMVSIHVDGEEAELTDSLVKVLVDDNGAEVLLLSGEALEMLINATVDYNHSSRVLNLTIAEPAG